MTSTKSNSDAELMLAKFARGAEYDALPPNVVELSKMGLLDTIGVMLAATTLEKAVVPVVNLVKEAGGSGVILSLPGFQ